MIFKFKAKMKRTVYSWKEIACNAHFGFQHSFSAEYSETDTLQCFQLLNGKWEFKRQSSSEHNFVEPRGTWLWTLPSPNLGLTIPPHLFVIAIRTWFGILMFLLQSFWFYAVVALQLIRLVTA